MSTDSWRATLPDDVLEELYRELRVTGVPAANMPAFSRKDWNGLTVRYWEIASDDVPAPNWGTAEMPPEWATVLRKASPCPSTSRSSWTNPLPVWLSPETGNDSDVTYCTFCYPRGSDAAAAGDIALLNRYDVYTHEKCGMHLTQLRFRAQQQAAEHAVQAAAPAAAAVPLDADTAARLTALELEVQKLKSSVDYIRDQLAKSMETMDGTITKLTASIPKAVNDALFGAEEQNRDQSGSASSKKLKYAAGGGNI
jgi:hypothetical protein